MPAFCKAYTEGTKNLAVAVHIAKGATAIAEWFSEHTSGRYHIALRKARAAMNAGSKPDKTYFIWLQGESDALAGTPQTVYEERMRYFRKNLIKCV